MKRPDERLSEARDDVTHAAQYIRIRRTTLRAWTHEAAGCKPLLAIPRPGYFSFVNLTEALVLGAMRRHYGILPAYERVKVAELQLMQLMNGRIGIEELIDECMLEYLPRGIVITQEHVNAVSRCLAEKYMDLTRQIDELVRCNRSEAEDGTAT